MNFIIKSLIILSIFVMSSDAIAGNGNGRANGNNGGNNHGNGHDAGHNGHRGNGHHHRGGSNGNGYGYGHHHAVPELDAAAAPLGILLIGGIVAAGFERRRKISIK